MELLFHQALLGAWEPCRSSACRCFVQGTAIWRWGVAAIVPRRLRARLSARLLHSVAGPLLALCLPSNNFNLFVVLKVFPVPHCGFTTTVRNVISVLGSDLVGCWQSGYSRLSRTFTHFNARLPLLNYYYLTLLNNNEVSRFCPSELLATLFVITKTSQFDFMIRVKVMRAPSLYTRQYDQKI